jgi:acetoin utilization protein AcuC
VLTISLHQDPRFLFPGTGMPTETGGPGAEGTAINVALPPGTGDDGWLRAFNAVVPGALRAFGPDVLVTQCGCDTHHEDPLAHLQLSVDGQRTAIELLHDFAHELTGGKWVAYGGGGYGVVRCVPRIWTHLLAEASGTRIDPATAIPRGWTEHVRARGVRGALPETMGEGRQPKITEWAPGGDSWLDRSIGATRNASYPLLGLDPDDPRD